MYCSFRNRKSFELQDVFVGCLNIDVSLRQAQAAAFRHAAAEVWAVWEDVRAQE